MHGEYARCGISHTNAKDSPKTLRDLTPFGHPQSPVLNPFPHIFSLLAKEMLVPLYTFSPQYCHIFYTLLLCIDVSFGILFIFSSILIAICTALSQLKCALNLHLICIKKC